MQFPNSVSFLNSPFPARCFAVALFAAACQLALFGQAEPRPDGSVPVDIHFRAYAGGREKCGFDSWIPTTPPRKFLQKQITESASPHSYTPITSFGSDVMWFDRRIACDGTLKFSDSATWTLGETATAAYYWGHGGLSVNQTIIGYATWNGETDGSGSSTDVTFNKSWAASDGPGVKFIVPGLSATANLTFTPGSVGSRTETNSPDTCTSGGSGTLVLNGSVGPTNGSPTADTLILLNLADITPCTQTHVLGEEYTDDVLVGKVWSDVTACSPPAWSDVVTRNASAATCSSSTLAESERYAYYRWDTNHLSLSIRRLQFRFKFQTKKNVNYILQWREAFTSDYAAPLYIRHKRAFAGTGEEILTPEYEATLPGVPPGYSGTNRVISYTVTETCEECKDCGELAIGSVDVTLGLGKSSFGQSAGFLWINEQNPTLAIATPASLRCSTGVGDVEVITNAFGIRQVKTPSLLANIITNSAFSYSVQYFSATNVGALSGGLYGTSGPPYLTWIIENPAASTNTFNQLRVVESRPSHSITNLYTYSSGSDTWTLVRGNGLRKESKQTTWSAGNTIRTEVEEIRDGITDALLSKVQKKFEIFSWGEGLIEEKVDPDNLALTTSYTYGTSSDDLGLIKSIDYPDGGWVNHSYSAKRVTHKYTPNLNDTNSSPYDTVYSYYAAGPNDDGSLEPYTPRGIGYPFPSRGIYNVVAPGIWSHYQGPASSSYADGNNMATITKYFTTGGFIGEVSSLQRPDGTMDIYSYATNAAGTFRTNIVSSGAPNSAGTAITNGTTTITVMGAAGQVYSNLVYDIDSGNLLISSEIHEYDEQMRPIRTTYLDGTSVSMGYDCCGLSALTNRDDSVVTYEYDSLKRKTAEHELLNGGGVISTLYAYDAAGQLRSVTKVGTNGASMLLQGFAYDMAGRKTFETNAVGTVTAYSYSTPGANGEHSLTTTFAYGTARAATKIELYYRDGRLKSLTGTAVHGSRFEYGFDSGFGAYTKEFFLDAAGDDSDEWRMTSQNYYQMPEKERFPLNSSRNLDTTATYNNKGQRTKFRDQRGVVTLYSYDTSGALRDTALDYDQDDQIDYGETDRIQRTLTDVASAHGTTVQRSRQYVWPTNNVDAPLLVGTTERSVDGFRTWRTAFGLTTSVSTHFAGGGIRYITNTAPDGTLTIQQYRNGRIVSSVVTNATLGVLQSATYQYDAFGRQSGVTDGRNGATTFTFNGLDQVTSIKTPVPGVGLNAQVTTNLYDELGRVWKVGYPDGTSMTNEYHLTGELKKTYGSRTYPVQYGYDYRGRMTTNITWQSFATGTGAAQTIWNYDSYGGVLLSKRYNDNKGPDYTYHTANGTPIGRLAARTWARGSSAAYNYNTAGEVSTVTYSGTPSTPNLTYTYDRLGRVATVVQGSTTTTLTYSDDGQLIKEAYSGGDLDGFAVTNSLNTLLIRSTNQVTLNNTPLTTSIYSYDSASRLSTVSDGNNSATYGYLANSPLVQTITFKEGTTTRMTTTKAYDYLNRLTSIASVPSADATVSYSYQYNDANQRTRVTMADGSYWLYQYDKLGQVTSGKKYWSDNTPVSGQQFGYAFDDIGNRTATQAGGDENGTNLRASSYAPNLLNQYTSRTVPNKVDIIGSATNTSTVSVNNIGASRKGEYYRAELPLDNSSGPVLLNVTNTAVVNNGPGGLDVVTNSVGTIFVPQATESYTHDDDGNLTTDGRWTYVWNAENRLQSMTANAGVPSAAKLKLEFSYDFIGRRTTKKIYSYVGGTYSIQSTYKYVYDGWNVVAQTDGSVTENFIWGLDMSQTLRRASGVGGLLFAQSSVTNRAVLFCYDGNGNVASTVENNSGKFDRRSEIGPYGEELRLIPGSDFRTTFGMTTKQIDDESGLVFFGRRYYNPSCGRWLSRDPSGESNHDGPNLYQITRGNAVNYFDPDGAESYQQFYDANGNWLAPNGMPKPAPQPSPTTMPSRIPKPPKEALGCCTDEVISAGEAELKNRYADAALQAAEFNLVPVPPTCPGATCKNTSSDILEFLAPFPKCWGCHLELRTKIRREFWRSPIIFDHQVIICTSYSKTGLTKEMMFDWWGDNMNNVNNSGGSPRPFRGEYPGDPEVTFNTTSFRFTDCNGNEVPSAGKPENVPFMRSTSREKY